MSLDTTSEYANRAVDLFNDDIYGHRTLYEEWNLAENGTVFHSPRLDPSGNKYDNLFFLQEPRYVYDTERTFQKYDSSFLRNGAKSLCNSLVPYHLRMCSTIPSSDFTPSAAGLTEENDISVCLSRIDGNYLESLLVQSYPGLIIGSIIGICGVAITIFTILSMFCRNHVCTASRKKFEEKALKLTKYFMIGFSILGAAGCFTVWSQGQLMTNGIDKVTDALHESAQNVQSKTSYITRGVEMFEDFTTKLRTGSENETSLVSKFLSSGGIQPYLNLTVDWFGPFSKSRDDWFVDVSLYEENQGNNYECWYNGTLKNEVISDLGWKVLQAKARRLDAIQKEGHSHIQIYKDGKRTNIYLFLRTFAAAFHETFKNDDCCKGLTLGLPDIRQEGFDYDFYEYSTDLFHYNDGVTINIKWKMDNLTVANRIEKKLEFISVTELEILNTNFKLFATDTKSYGSSHWPVHDVVEPQKAYPQPWLNSWDSEWGLKRVTGIFAQITENNENILEIRKIDEVTRKIEVELDDFNKKVEVHLKIAENFLLVISAFVITISFAVIALTHYGFEKPLAIGMITFTFIMCGTWFVFAILTSLGTFLDDFITILENFKEKPLSSDLGDLIGCPRPETVLASQAEFRQGVGIATQILNSILKTTITFTNSTCPDIIGDFGGSVKLNDVFECLSTADLPLFEELVKANNGSYSLLGFEQLPGFDGFFSPPYQPIVLHRHNDATSNILLFCQGYNGLIDYVNSKYSWSADPRFTEELCEYILNGENRDAFLNARPFEVSSPVPYNHSFQWMDKFLPFDTLFRDFSNISPYTHELSSLDEILYSSGYQRQFNLFITDLSNSRPDNSHLSDLNGIKTMVWDLFYFLRDFVELAVEFEPFINELANCQFLLDNIDPAIDGMKDMRNASILLWKGCLILAIGYFLVYICTVMAFRYIRLKYESLKHESQNQLEHDTL